MAFTKVETAGINSTGSLNLNGPVLIGSATSTGTASQLIQVTGGAYVSGSVGVGTTNPGAKLHVSGGNIKLDSGYGIDFSADANNAGMTSELLNDYETGTFTPSLSGSFTYGASRIGEYTKIGNLVNVNIIINWTANSSGAVAFTVSGLPFTVASTRTTVSLGYIAGLDTGADKMITATSSSGSTSYGFWIINDNTNPSPMQANAVSATGELQLTGTYQT